MTLNFKKQKMNRFLIMMLAVLCIFSCREESTIESTDKIPLGVDTNFEQLVYGQVLTPSGDPLSNVLVSVKDDTYMTDEYGLFKFEKVFAGNMGTQISANKEGYLYGGYRLYAGEVGSSHVEIVLMEANDLGDVNAISGGTINVSPNSTVSFPSDAFTLNGSVYSGNVNVLGNWIDPTNEDMLRLTPGDLTGVNIESERVVLTSFGMIGIELRTDNGEELQIAENKNVELKYEIPEAILNEAPTTIPLWSFDEENGIWIEEETATLVGNQYVGSVSHFTWWNTDIPNSVVEFCIALVDATTGAPLANQEIKILNLSGYGCAWGITNSRGVICGVLPENSEFEVIIIMADNQCPEGNPTYTIGEYTLNDSPVSETLPVDYNTDVIINNISGTVTDCQGNPVTNATVLFSSDFVSEIVITDVDGNYSQAIVTCDAIEELEITAVDFVSEVSGETVLNDLSGGDTTADITMCDQFIDATWLLTSNSGFIMIDDAVAKVKPFETIITSENSLELLGFSCQTTGPCSGSYSGSFGGAIDDVQLNILEFGNIGEVIKGTFSGVNQNGDTVTGNFNVERVE